jgi:hypothetical protein
VELDLLRASNEAVEPLMQELSGEVIASLSGVLRKIERKREGAPGEIS